MGAKKCGVKKVAFNLFHECLNRWFNNNKKKPLEHNGGGNVWKKGWDKDKKGGNPAFGVAKKN